MSKATDAHVEKLKPLSALCNEEDIEFFHYVVAQEVAQADALKHLLNKRYDLAAQVINEFLEKQTIVRAKR